MPKFKTKIDSATILMTETSQSWKMILPEIVSPDPDANKSLFSLKADFGDAGNFVKLDGLTSIEIDDISEGGNSNIRPGMYLIKFTLNDSKTKAIA